MTSTKKLDLLMHVWENDADIRNWYTTQIDNPVDPDQFTAQSVNHYGLNGHGEIADLIIKDGVENGTITAEQALNQEL